MKEVAIIVVTYNRLTLLKEVIESLRNQTFNSSQIIVINNGSTDNTLNWLEEQEEIITITQENLGGAGGFFTGMKYAAENGYRYCWIMDDDVICKSNALEELYNTYHLKENIGFVCSKVVGIDGSPMNTPEVDTRPSKNGYPDWMKMIDYGLIKVKNATFVSVFLSTQMIFDVGLPLKEFFIWGDDTEYTQRLSSKYECYVSVKSIVVHKRTIQGILSFDNENDPKRINNFFYSIRNGGYIQNKEASTIRRALFYIKKLKSALKYFIKGQILKSRIILKAIFSLITFNPKIQYPIKVN